MAVEIPPLVVRMWRERDGWHLDLAVADGTKLEDLEDVPDLDSGFESPGALRATYKAITGAMYRASFVRLDSRPDDAD